MSVSRRRWFRPLIVALAALQIASPVMAGDPVFRVGRLIPFLKDDVGHKPKTAKDPCIEELAKNIDWLEHHIDLHGTVVAKSPDVWGEARLTAHRQEFENALKAELNSFNKDQINGSDFVNDQAFLSFAMAMKGTADASPASPPPQVGAAVKTGVDKDGNPTAEIVSSFVGPETFFGQKKDEPVPFKNSQIQLEQTETLDQLARYINHLHQLRRLNEGDDTSDAPGYSMNLVRVPVSVLPGQRTKKGYAAEITVTAEPYLGPELLPSAFRDLVTNDLVDQLSLPMTRFLNGDRDFKNRVSTFASDIRAADPAGDTNKDLEAIEKEIKNFNGVLRSEAQQQLAAQGGTSYRHNLIDSLFKTANFPTSNARKSTLPFPSSQILDNFGIHQMAQLAFDADAAFSQDVINEDVVHLNDVEGFIKEEVGAAYELMATAHMLQWWQRAAESPRELPDLIRLRKVNEIHNLRNEFIASISDQSANQSTASLAWCVYVDSLLLNERLVQDMKETFGNHPTNVATCGDWMAFFGPNPDSEARRVFAEYVKVRWPIRVFALDPQVNEQNIADVSSVYRQMQMSIAFAHADKSLSTSQALQAMRKLQRDRATVDLNRTAIGFGHGDDTFGWRFYPRFQTPPVEGNATVLVRDLILGGPTDRQLEKSEEIEPGMRECVAVVLMPSFVPHVTFNTRGNWFKITCGSHGATSIQDTMEYSRAVKQMEMNAQQCVRCAHLYRDGEVDRLIKRVHQIDRKLALQTLNCDVPIENTHGGFEILSSGSRELAPELTGWYGAPGYDRSRHSRFFITGDNFSVTQTRLIVGNTEIPYKLVSRQIMEVTLPPGLPVIHDKRLDAAKIDTYEGFVDAQVATPYGVSGHLLIPVVREADACSPKPQEAAILTTEFKLWAKVTTGMNGKCQIAIEPNTAQEPLELLRYEDQSGKTAGRADKEKLVLYISHGNERLFEAYTTAVSAGDGRTFVVDAPETIAQLALDGANPPANLNLGNSLIHYLNFVLNSPRQHLQEYRFDVAVGKAADAGGTSNDSSKPTSMLKGNMSVLVSMKYN